MSAVIRGVLFVEPQQGVEDLLLALPAMHAVARARPRAQIEVLTSPAGGQLLAADPFVDRVHVVQGERAFGGVDRLLTSERFDLVIAHPGSSGMPAEIGECKNVRCVDLARIPRLCNDGLEDGRAWVDALQREGLAGNPASDDGRVYLSAAERATADALAARGPLVALLIGDSSPRFLSTFASIASEVHRRFAASIIVLPGESEALARDLARRIAPAQSLADSSLRRVLTVLAAADVAVCTDYGGSRLAAAVGAPAVVIRRSRTAEQKYGIAAQAASAEGPQGGEEDLPARDVLEAVAPFLTREPATPSSAPTFSSGRRRWPWQSAQKAWLRARKLLVVRADNIGDVVMAGPALRAIKRTRPKARLTLLASPAGAEAAALLPWVDDVIGWRVLWQDIGGEPANPDAEAQLIDKIAERRFDAAIILTSFSQSPHPAAFIAWLAGIPLRAGVSRERSALLTHQAPFGPVEQHQVERNLSLVSALGFEHASDSMQVHVPDGAKCGAAALLAAQGLRSGESYMLLGPWASAAARSYDPVRAARAAKLIASATGLRVVVTGHARDAARIGMCAQRIGSKAIDLCGATSVSELAALVAGAQLVLTANTALLHLADALRVPSVVVFAGTDLPSQWAPRCSPHRMLRRPTRCSPCYALTCPLDHACMDIEPADVANAAFALLNAADGERGAGRCRTPP